MVYPVEMLFVPRKSTIVIEIGSSYGIKNSTSPESQKAAKILSEEDKIKLDEGLFAVFKPPKGLERKKNYEEEK